MSKHTHRGNCQVCGALQAANPVLAKHGYKVKDFGYFAGVCPGSAFEPLQVSRVECDRVCADLLVHAAGHEAMVADYTSGARVPDVAMTDRSEWVNKKKVTVMLPWADASQYYRELTINNLVHQHGQQARFARFHVRDMQALAVRLLGQPLVAVAHKPAPVEIHTGMVFTWSGAEWVVTGAYGARWWARRTTSDNKFLFTTRRIRAGLVSEQVAA